METGSILHYGNMNTLNQTHHENTSGMNWAFPTLPGPLGKYVKYICPKMNFLSLVHLFL